MGLSGFRSVVLVTAGCALAIPAGVQGQASPLVLEARGGAAVPVASFADGPRLGEGSDPAGSFGVGFTLAGAGRSALYGGFSQHRFGCSDAGCGADGVFVATGFDVGFRIDLLQRGSVVPWLRLGAVTTQVEVPALLASDGDVSSLGFGGEVGLGLYVGVASPVALVPGIRVTAVNTELPGGGLLRMRYVVADVALALAF